MPVFIGIPKMNKQRGHYLVKEEMRKGKEKETGSGGKYKKSKKGYSRKRHSNI